MTGSPPWWKQEPKSDGLGPGSVSPSGGAGQHDSGDGAAVTVSGGKSVVGGGGGPNRDRQTRCRAGYDMIQQPS